MSPFYETCIADTLVDVLCKKYPKQKRADWQHIIRDTMKIPFCKANAQQNKISCLTVCKNTAPEQISIGIEESSRYGEKDSNEQCF